MPKYKTQTNDLTEVIEAGGGGGKLYLHAVNFSSSTGIIKTPEGTTLISSIILYIICSSPVILNSWADYQNLLTKNQTKNKIYIPFNYDNQYVSSQDTIISSGNTYIYNTPDYKTLTTNVRYFKIGSTNAHLSDITDSSYTSYYNKDNSIVIPLE